jgi:hypothetical protein
MSSLGVPCIGDHYPATRWCETWLLRVGLPFGEPLKASCPEGRKRGRGWVFLNIKASIEGPGRIPGHPVNGRPSPPQDTCRHDLLVGQNEMPGRIACVAVRSLVPACNRPQFPPPTPRRSSPLAAVARPVSVRPVRCPHAAAGPAGSLIHSWSVPTRGPSS